MKFGSPTRIKISPSRDKKQFQFLLSFSGRSQRVEFETTSDAAMLLMMALQRVQMIHKIPIPRQLRPTGKPKLSIVKLDE